MRGETVEDEVEAAFGVGLSPRARGNPGPALRDAEGRRPIPACAGKPGEFVALMNILGAYPRVRGETPKNHIWVRKSDGLSPRARGNLAQEQPA